MDALKIYFHAVLVFFEYYGKARKALGIYDSVRFGNFCAKQFLVKCRAIKKSYNEREAWNIKVNEKRAKNKAKVLRH